MKISLVLLTFNEIEGLTALFDKIPLDCADEAFAVDGGSTDGTLEFYKEKNFKVVNQISKGRGEAFRIAFESANSDAIIFYSPDGNEDYNDIPKFRDFLEKGYDMVIASRMMKGAFNEEDDKIIRFRKWANNFFNFAANLAWGSIKKNKYITDSINGFRAITKKAFHTIKPDANGYCIEYQMTILSMKQKLKTAEFPTHEGKRIGGESYAKSIPTGLKFIKQFMLELIRK